MMCNEKEKIYLKIVDLFLPEYQRVQDRLELRKDLISLDINSCRRVYKMYLPIGASNER